MARAVWLIGLTLAAALAGPGRALAVVCTGDCDGDGSVNIAELVNGVALGLGEPTATPCDGFGAPPVRIESLIRAAANALSSCGPEASYLGPPPSLAFADVVRNAPKHLDYVRGVAISPDGGHVYVASNLGLAIFARQPAGQLAFSGDVADVTGAGGVVVSPDGHQVYAFVFGVDESGRDLSQIVTFSRDTNSGALAWRQALSADPYLAHLVIGADGRTVYVAGSEESFAPDTPALRALSRNPTTGLLTDVGTLSWHDLGLSWVRTLALDDDHVYAAGDGPPDNRYDGWLVELRRESNGSLTVERRYDPGVLGIWWVGGLAVATDDTLYLSGREEIDPEHSREVLLQLTRPMPAAPFAVVARTPDDDNVSPDHLAVSPDAGLLALGGSGTLGLYAIGAGGALTPRGLLAHAGGSYATGVLAFAPDGGQVYAATHVADGITRYDTAPQLALVETWRGTLGGIDGIVGVRQLAQSADAATVYATGDEHTLAVFARDPDSGALDPRQVVRSREEGAPYLDGINDSTVAVSGDGANVYATIVYGESVVSFSRAADGTLQPLGELLDIARDGNSAEEFPYGLAISPDGTTVYASGSSDVDGRAFVAVLARDPSTGALTWDGGVRDGGGMLVCSADAATLYGVSGPLAGWARGAGGALTALGLDVGVTGDVLALSPDGAHAYLAAAGRPTISVLARAADGRLTALGDDDAGLAGVDALAVSPDGRSVYAVSSSESALSILARRADGRLTWRARYRDGSGADGLSGAAAVLASADGRTVYVAGAGESAIAIFHVVGDPLYANGEPCEDDQVCASGVCDFSLRAFGDGVPAGPIFPEVCCERVCDLDQACDDNGVCQPRPLPAE